MRMCMVLFCKSRDITEGVSFFYLTKKRYTAWMAALGRDVNIEQLSARNVVCSKHFTDDDFLHVKGKKRLKPNAIPSLNVGPRKPLTSQTNLIPHHHQKSNIIMPTTSSGSNQISSVEYKENIPEDVDNSSDTSGVSRESSKSKKSSSSTITCDSFTVPTGTFLKRKLETTSSSDSEGFKGPAKKIRRDVKMFHNYSTSIPKVTKSLQELRTAKYSLQKKMKIKKEQIKRLKRKVTSLKDILMHLRKKSMISDDAMEVCKKSFSGVPSLLMTRFIQNSKRSKKGKKQGRDTFHEELRSFALTLQFYSSKAYNYVRKTFNLALPAPSTIRSWLSNVNCEPGYSECSFISLRNIVADDKRQNKDTICSLILDEKFVCFPKKNCDFSCK